MYALFRARPDIARDWTDDEVALEWRRLYPPRDPATGHPVEPSDHDINMITSNPARVAERRDRLASLEGFRGQGVPGTPYQVPNSGRVADARPEGFRRGRRGSGDTITRAGLPMRARMEAPRQYDSGLSQGTSLAS